MRNNLFHRLRRRMFCNPAVSIGNDKIGAVFNFDFEPEQVDSIDAYQTHSFIMTLKFNSKNGLLGIISEDMPGWEMFWPQLLERFPDFNVDVFEWLSVTHHHAERCWQRGIANPYMDNFIKYKNEILQNGFSRIDKFKNKSLVCFSGNKIVIKKSHFSLRRANFTFDVNDVVMIEAYVIEPFIRHFKFSSSGEVLGWVSEETKGWVPFFNELASFFPAFDYGVFDKMNGCVERVLMCWKKETC